MQLEDSGGSGSAGAHFEKLIFGDDTMVSDDTKDAKFTEMTLAVAEDFGVYTVDYGMAEDYFWAKNEGCDHFTKTCPTSTVNEYCANEDHVSCSDNLLYRSLCQYSEFTDPCNINLQFSWCKNEKSDQDAYFIYGHDSICHNITLNDSPSSQCFKVECASDNSSYKVFTNDGREDKEYTCTEKGTVHDPQYISFSFKCQDPADVCKNHTDCPDDCNYRGVCLKNKTCECIPLYSGSTCGTFNGCPNTVDSDVCDAIVSSNHFGKNKIEVTSTSNTSDNNSTTNNDDSTTTDDGSTTSDGTRNDPDKGISNLYAIINVLLMVVFMN